MALRGLLRGCTLSVGRRRRCGSGVGASSACFRVEAAQTPPPLGLSSLNPAVSDTTTAVPWLSEPGRHSSGGGAYMAVGASSAYLEVQVERSI